MSLQKVRIILLLYTWMGEGAIETCERADGHGMIRNKENIWRTEDEEKF